MPEYVLEADVRCPPERVFEVITDLRGQGDWLAGSAAFRGTHEVSPGPLAVGTTYREPSPFGVRHGTVTELERPRAVTFDQPMTVILRLGTIGVTVRYTLSPQGAATRVRRQVTLRFPRPLRPLTPLLVPIFRAEGRRTMRALEAHVDGLA